MGSQRAQAESEADASPPLTTLRSPYDLSKAMAEQFILQKHSKVMRTVSVRIGGVTASVASMWGAIGANQLKSTT